MLKARISDELHAYSHFKLPSLIYIFDFRYFLFSYIGCKWSPACIIYPVCEHRIAGDEFFFPLDRYKNKGIWKKNTFLIVLYFRIFFCLIFFNDKSVNKSVDEQLFKIEASNKPKISTKYFRAFISYNHTNKMKDKDYLGLYLNRAP